MINNIKEFFNRKQEMVAVFIFTIAIFLTLFFLTDTVSIYNSNSLNPLILSIFGTLFGLLLTSYAILFGLIPALSIDTLETDALKNVNFRFFFSLILNIFILIFGFVIIFVKESLKSYFIYSQIFLTIYLILMFLLLIFYLFVLFNGARNNAIKKVNKKS